MAVDVGKVQVADKDGVLISNGNPFPVNLQLGGTTIQGTFPLPVSIQIGNTRVASTYPVPVEMELGGSPVSSTNPIPVAQPGGTGMFFSNGTASSTGFTPQVTFGLTSRHVIIVNDGTNDISFSFDGATTHGLIHTNETAAFDDKQATQIYVKATTVGGTYRVWAW